MTLPGAVGRPRGEDRRSSKHRADGPLSDSMAGQSGRLTLSNIVASPYRAPASRMIFDRSPAYWGGSPGRSRLVNRQASSGLLAAGGGIYGRLSPEWAITQPPVLETEDGRLAC